MKSIKRTRGQMLPIIDEVAREFGLWGNYTIIDEPPINEADGALQGQQIAQLTAIVTNPDFER